MKLLIDLFEFKQRKDIALIFMSNTFFKLGNSLFFVTDIYLGISFFLSSYNSCKRNTGSRTFFSIAIELVKEIYIKLLKKLKTEV